MQKEIWKDIPDYEGFYKISNLGNVKSLSRIVLKKGKYPFYSKERILSKSMSNGYYCLGLRKNNKSKNFYIHYLLAITFIDKDIRNKGLVVDHINNIRDDNRLENLQIISYRENCSKDKKNKSSKYTGVSWYKNYGLWTAQAQTKDKTKNLGYFKTEYEAHLAYQNHIINLQNQN